MSNLRRHLLFSIYSYISWSLLCIWYSTSCLCRVCQGTLIRSVYLYSSSSSYPQWRQPQRAKTLKKKKKVTERKPINIGVCPFHWKLQLKLSGSLSFALSFVWVVQVISDPCLCRRFVKLLSKKKVFVSLYFFPGSSFWLFGCL